MRISKEVFSRRQEPGTRSHRTLPVAFLSLAAVLAAVLPAKAQYYTSGDDPASLRWNQLTTEHFRLVYPRGDDSLAYRYARLFESESLRSMEGLYRSPEAFEKHLSARWRLPVVLHTQTSEANGLVAWVPLRLEVYSQPSPTSEPLSWDQTLALHECRHVAQVYRTGEGWFRPLHFLFGDQSESVSCALVDFFSPGLLEGDAVVAETEFSEAGRGRTASFLMDYHARFADSVHFSYDKWHYGSYKHSTPNEYALGYLKYTSARFRNAAGLEDPSKAMAVWYDSYRWHPVFQRKAYRRAFGARTVKLWQPAVDLYTQWWHVQDSLRVTADGPFDRRQEIAANDACSLGTATAFAPASIVEGLTAPGKYHLSYRYPIVYDGKVYADRYSLARNDELVCLDLLTPEVLFPLGYLNSPLRAAGPYVFWTELDYDVRWQHAMYSNLYGTDLRDGKRLQFTEKSHYHLPAPAPDMSFVAVAEYLPDGSSQLVLLSVGDWKPALALPLPYGDNLMEIAWRSGTRLYVTVQTPDGLGIRSVDLLEEEWTEVLPPQHRTIAGLACYAGRLYFQSDLDGTDNLYCLDPDTKALHRMTHERFGAFDPFLDHSYDGAPTDWYYAYYTADGYGLCRRPAQNMGAFPADFSRPSAHLMDKMLAKEAAARPTGQSESPAEPAVALAPEGFAEPAVALVPESPDESAWQVKRYSKPLHLLRLHSWAPLYFDRDGLSELSGDTYYENVAPGFLLLSQNDLGTAMGQLGYSRSQGYDVGHLKYVYTGWYPKLTVSATINDGPRVLYNLDEQKVQPTDGLSQELDVLVSLPLDYSSGGFAKYVQPSFRWHYTNDLLHAGGRQSDRTVSYSQASLQFAHYRRMATRDIFPSSGRLAGLSLTVPASVWQTSVLQAYATAYLRGFAENHAFKLSLRGSQHFMREDTRLLLSSQLQGRGMEQSGMPQQLKFSLDYALPIDLDLSVPGLVYLKRLQCIPFADALWERDVLLLVNGSERLFQPTWRTQDKQSQRVSAGAELLLDLVPLRINVAVSAGARLTWASDAGFSSEFLLSVPLLQ